jgi:hypothetical protein
MYGPAVSTGAETTREQLAVPIVAASHRVVELCTAEQCSRDGEMQTPTRGTIMEKCRGAKNETRAAGTDDQLSQHGTVLTSCFLVNVTHHSEMGKRNTRADDGQQPGRQQINKDPWRWCPRALAQCIMCRPLPQMSSGWSHFHQRRSCRRYCCFHALHRLSLNRQNQQIRHYCHLNLCRHCWAHRQNHHCYRLHTRRIQNCGVRACVTLHPNGAG